MRKSFCMYLCFSLMFGLWIHSFFFSFSFLLSFNFKSGAGAWAWESVGLCTTPYKLFRLDLFLSAHTCWATYFFLFFPYFFPWARVE